MSFVRFDPTVRHLDEFVSEPAYIAVHNGHVLVSTSDAANGAADGSPWPETPPPGEHFMIGTLDDRPCVAVNAPDPAPHDAEWVSMRALYRRVPEAWWSIAGRAVQIVNWDRTHHFCGVCATPTERLANEWARRCPRCGLIVYPRLSPAVIVLVTRGAHDEQALLVWGKARETPFFSTIAGFVEPGESLEHAVAREVREESGIEVRDVAYFGSQAWPFPNQLMIGFYARYAAGEIAVQPSEVREARWITPPDLDLLPTSRGPMSISGWLIEGWVTRDGRSGDWFR